MQRLYERVYFDNFDLESCLFKVDFYKDGSVAVDQFIKVITQEISSLGESEAI